ncbi:hypothetical protein HPB52_000597 [Rhipicephalus sanguineus]|uniref:Uncharacterized protein n=1 Tax=Rhipicephalus sanguineus TaxID=34632 RepID=A0A9D4QCA1_RHISA|nr:hypothetical protein HPB52_000597 [Rhipicephalus sanguineus]
MKPLAQDMDYLAEVRQKFESEVVSRAPRHISYAFSTAYKRALADKISPTDNGSIIVSHSVVVSRGKTTNISSSVIIRNKKKTAYTPSAGNVSGVSTRRKGCTADVVRTKTTELVKSIDYGWVHQKRARREALDYNASDVNNTAATLKASHLDNDTKLILILLIALLLLALSSIMSYRPPMEHPYCIRLRPGAPPFYQPVPTSECWDAVEHKSNLGPRDKRFMSLVRTKILASRMVRRWRGRSDKQPLSFQT